jgi:hypothetical protein
LEALDLDVSAHGGTDAVTIGRVEERFERQARNEALMRTVNEQIAAADKRAAGWADATDQFAFQCECGKVGCEDRVLMTMSEYERARSQRDRFALVPGHENDQIEDVVERQDDRYVIVDKRDEVEPLVE